MSYLTDALSPHVGIPRLNHTSSELLEALTCDLTNADCMLRKCPHCKNSECGFDPKLTHADASRIFPNCKQWVADKTGRLTVEYMKWDLQRCFDEFSRRTEHFLYHVYVKRSQETFFADQKNAVDSKTVVVQVDIAENYTLQLQHEIQSAHWRHSQCTVFTAHVWVGPNVHECFAIISDELIHDKYSVYKYLDTILEHLRNNYEGITKVQIFSDGARCQFKQRFLFSYLHVLEAQHGMSITWNFFASSHGKGVVDGHGATVKQAFWRRVKAGQLVRTAEEFAEVARTACPNLTILFVSKETIAENKTDLDEHWKGVKALPSTHITHCVKSIAPYVVSAAMVSYAPPLFNMCPTKV